MNQIADLTKHPANWNISVQLLIMYVVSVVLFFVIHWGNLKVVAPLAAKAKGALSLALIPIFVLAAVTCFIGVATVVVLSKKLTVVPPLAMVALPLFLVLESHVRKLIAAKDQTAFHLSGCAGVLLGIASASWIWMRHNPLV